MIEVSKYRMWNVLSNNWLQLTRLRYLLERVVKAHHSDKQNPNRLVVINILESVYAAEKNGHKEKLAALFYDIMSWWDAYITHLISYESVKNSTRYKISMKICITYHA